MIILDTDVLIDVIDHREPTFSFVANLRSEGAVLGTTSVNVSELFRGVPAGTRAARRAATALYALNEIPLGPRGSRRYGQLMQALDRAGNPVPGIDGLVAAVALETGGRLVTRNVRHFDRIAGLELLVPPG